MTRRIAIILRRASRRASSSLSRFLVFDFISNEIAFSDGKTVGANREKHTEGFAFVRYSLGIFRLLSITVRSLRGDLGDLRGFPKVTFKGESTDFLNMCLIFGWSIGIHPGVIWILFENIFEYSRPPWRYMMGGAGGEGGFRSSHRCDVSIGG